MHSILKNAQQCDLQERLLLVELHALQDVQHLAVTWRRRRAVRLRVDLRVRLVVFGYARHRGVRVVGLDDNNSNVALQKQHMSAESLN